MVTKANNIKGTWYVECDIFSPKELRESTPIQLPVVRGKTHTTNQMMMMSFICSCGNKIGAELNIYPCDDTEPQ
jgi:hypothetical protein